MTTKKKKDLPGNGEGGSIGKSQSDLDNSRWLSSQAGRQLVTGNTRGKNPSQITKCLCVVLRHLELSNIEEWGVLFLLHIYIA